MLQNRLFALISASNVVVSIWRNYSNPEITMADAFAVGLPPYLEPV
jgi:hypothetical protein